MGVCIPYLFRDHRVGHQTCKYMTAIWEPAKVQLLVSDIHQYPKLFSYFTLLSGVKRCVTSCIVYAKYKKMTGRSTKCNSSFVLFF